MMEDFSAVFIVIGFILSIIVGCAYLSGKLAKKKGYDPTIFYFIGGLFGIIGVAIAAIVPPKKYFQTRDFNNKNSSLEIEQLRNRIAQLEENSRHDNKEHKTSL